MNYLKYVNIKQGTKSAKRFSNGNTLPLVQLPFGFASFAPQTQSGRTTWFYHPEDRSFEGIRLTHQPSPWIGDHGAIVICPQSEEPYMNADARWSGFVPEKTVLMPHYMRYYLTRQRATLELTPTEYGAYIRLEFDNQYDNYLSVLPAQGLCGYRFDAEKNRLYCFTDCNDLVGYDKGKAKSYFVFDFGENTINADKNLIENTDAKNLGNEITEANTAIHLFLNTKKITFRMAASYISYEQAEENLKRDNTFHDFDSLMAENEKIWNEHLSRIEIQADENTLKTFYSCMYRVFLYPHKAYETDKNGKAIHYSPSADCVKDGVRYTDNGFWDTYRTVYPLFSIIAKKRICRNARRLYRRLSGRWMASLLDSNGCKKMYAKHAD